MAENINFLQVSGNEVYLGSYLVATLNPNMWATLEDEVISLINNSDTSELEKEQEKALEENDSEWKEKVEDLELKVEAKDEEISDLENKVEDLEGQIESIEGAGGVHGRIKELEAENDEWRAKVAALQQKVRELLPQPKRTYRKRAA